MSGVSVKHCDYEQQRCRVLARLRSYGPTFANELIAEGLTDDPFRCVASLCTEGYHIESLRTFRSLPDGSQRWDVLLVMRVKNSDTGAVIATPVPVGSFAHFEKWKP
jgi:hypothetical protein